MRYTYLINLLVFAFVDVYLPGYLNSPMILSHSFFFLRLSLLYDNFHVKLVNFLEEKNNT